MIDLPHYLTVLAAWFAAHSWADTVVPLAALVIVVWWRVTDERAVRAAADDRILAALLLAETGRLRHDPLAPHWRIETLGGVALVGEVYTEEIETLRRGHLLDLDVTALAHGGAPAWLTDEGWAELDRHRTPRPGLARRTATALGLPARKVEEVSA